MGNGVLDDAELYYDLNNDGQYNSFSEFGAEPFQDANCNGIWDDAETEDVGNGIWDDAEEDDGSGLGSKVTSIPSSLLFDYSNSPPTPVIEIDEFTSIEDANGNMYNVLDITTIFDTVYTYIPKVDSVVTIFSNEEITHFAADVEDDDPSNDRDLDYVITKTRTAYDDPVREGFDISEYAYNIFSAGENHIKELKNPSFFLPYGFYETPEAISDGFGLMSAGIL